MENVSWNDIQEYIRKLNMLTGEKYRLPTVAEWDWLRGKGIIIRQTQYNFLRDDNNISFGDRSKGGIRFAGGHPNNAGFRLVHP